MIIILKIAMIKILHQYTIFLIMKVYYQNVMKVVGHAVNIKKILHIIIVYLVIKIINYIKNLLIV